MRCPAGSALDKIECIYADIPPHTDHTYGWGAAAGLVPGLARGWIREHCWKTADTIFEVCGYSEGGSTTRLTAKRAGRFVARSVLSTNKTKQNVFNCIVVLAVLEVNMVEGKRRGTKTKYERTEERRESGRSVSRR